MQVIVVRGSSLYPLENAALLAGRARRDQSPILCCAQHHRQLGERNSWVGAIGQNRRYLFQTLPVLLGES